jgi:acetyltransferase-like isoleucine patch superfamily enzyme
MRAYFVQLYEAVTQFILGLPRVPPLQQAKRALLRSLGAGVGHNVTIYPDVWIMPISGKLQLGSGVDLARGVMITTQGGVAIGDRALIGYGTRIISSNHHIPARPARIAEAGHDDAPIAIGPDCWLGANVIVLPGVKVGEGSVVAAGAVVARDVPPFAVVAGVPARVLRFRDEASNA